MFSFEYSKVERMLITAKCINKPHRTSNEIVHLHTVRDFGLILLS